MQNKDFLANNILEIVTNPRTTSEPQNKEKLEKINEQLESTIGNLNNQNNTMKKAPTLLAMTQGQTEGLSLKSEIKEGLDKVVTSNISAANLGNKAAMYTSLLLGQATSKDKTVYLAVKPAIDNAVGPIYTKAYDMKLASNPLKQAATQLDASSADLAKDANSPSSYRRR